MGVPIVGTCEESFAAVRAAFAANFADRGEVGEAVCVIRGGEIVVDLVGGWSDGARTQPWTPDTIVDFYSVGKALVAISLLQLVDAGRIGLDDPISSVWPEFATGGKEMAPVRHALCHRAGVPAIAEQGRCAELLWEQPAMLPDAFALDGDARMTMMSYFNPPGYCSAGLVNTSAWRRAQIPATNGNGTAKGVDACGAFTG